jgi:hypothetical protein
MAFGTHAGLEQKLKGLDVEGRASKGLEILDGPPVADGAKSVVLGMLVVQPVGSAAEI